MLIRSATPEDAGAVAKLGLSFVGKLALPVDHDIDTMTDIARTLIANEAAVVFLAIENGAEVAMLIGMESALWFSPKTRIAAELAWWVDEDFRGGSIAHRLVKAFEDWAKDRDLDMAVLSDIELLDNAQPAGRLIEHLGYTMHERAFMKELVH